MFHDDNITSEEKKLSLRKYLEENGVTEAITGIFNKIILAKEKPDNPIDFVRQELGGSPVSQETFDNLDMQVEEARREIRSLRKRIVEMGLGDQLEPEHWRDENLLENQIEHNEQHT